MVGAFTAFILFGTALLWLPISADGPGHIGLEDALFTSTSAATVTGLGSTDISRFSLFGELVIMMLIQIGGFGIMTIGSVLAIVASQPRRAAPDACSRRPRSAPSTWATSAG